MSIENIYNLLRKLNFVESQETFSRIYLGKSNRYYSMLMAANRKPSSAALTHLVSRLKQLVDEEGNDLLARLNAKDHIERILKELIKDIFRKF
jgi:hypothetical protein